MVHGENYRCRWYIVRDTESLAPCSKFDRVVKDCLSVLGSVDCNISYYIQCKSIGMIAR
jgi:hypothetical protein